MAGNDNKGQFGRSPDVAMVLFMILLVVVAGRDRVHDDCASGRRTIGDHFEPAWRRRSFMSSLHVQRQRSGTAIPSTWRELGIQLPHQLLGDDTVLVHIRLEQPQRRIHRLERSRILEESFPRLLSMLVVCSIWRLLSCTARRSNDVCSPMGLQQLLTRTLHQQQQQGLFLLDFLCTLAWIQYYRFFPLFFANASSARSSTTDPFFPFKYKPSPWAASSNIPQILSISSSLQIQICL